MEMKTQEMEECHVCCVCGMKCSENKIRHIDIKGKTRKICKECATAIKGLS